MHDSSDPSKTYLVHKTFFNSHGTKCGAHLYLPREIQIPPVVIMAHGFGAQMNFGLLPFAERFLKYGMAVFMFDYRHFGESEGLPRNLVNPFMHIEDWKSAVAYVRTLKEVNTEKIGLWGTSFSGGHVIVVAAADPDISAIVSQVPFTDGISTIINTRLRNIKDGLIAGVRDLIRKISFRDPFFVPILSGPDTFAVLNTPDAPEALEILIPKGIEYENKCPARITLMLGFYRPVHYASKVKCPALVIKGEHDALFAKNAADKAAHKMPKGELVTLPCGHFSPYAGEFFEKIVTLETDFLVKHLFG
ncbi:MAG: alpha/beta hydrolase [Proteobacteria bacterium]|nr:alpha/beta hydrolase [Pseudomonadota bacterium]